MIRAENKILLSDQSPWTGGWLRMGAVAAIGLLPKYFIQDADVPWRQGGGFTPSVRNNWTDYWSLAAKNPWTPSVPGVEIGNVRNSFRAPSGLAYLTGPNTSKTIHSERQNYHLADLVIEFLVREANWARTVGGFLGITDSNYKSDQWIDALKSCRTISDLYRSLGQTHGVDNSQGLVDLFSSHPPLLVNELGKHRYWSVDRQGHRHEYSHRSDGVVVPKGQVLILELCAKGFTFAYTGLKYLDRQIELRNQLVPGLELNLLQVSFAWSLFPEPVSQLVEVFSQKKASRGEEVKVSAEDVRRVQDYWKGRPTTISLSILGGDINPSLETQVF